MFPVERILNFTFHLFNMFSVERILNFTGCCSFGSDSAQCHCGHMASSQTHFLHWLVFSSSLRTLRNFVSASVCEHIRRPKGECYQPATGWLRPRQHRGSRRHPVCQPTEPQRQLYVQVSPVKRQHEHFTGHLCSTFTLNLYIVW